MDASEVFVRIFNIGEGIYQAERARRRNKQRSSELKELGDKVVEISSAGGRSALESAPEKAIVGETSQKEKQPQISAFQSEESHSKPPVAVKERSDLDLQTLAYQEDKALAEAYLLEDHLKAGCHECGEASDCCWKHCDKLARYAHETMSMTTDPFWQNLRDLALEIKGKTHPDDVRADTYASEYPIYAVRVSEFRRPLQQKAMERAKPVLTLEEAKAEAAKLAEQEVEKLWQSQEKK